MNSPIDPPNRKAYLHRWERDEEDRNITYWFCEFAKDAAHWDSLRSAENARDILNIGVTIASVQGGTHTLRNFEIEEFAPNHYVIHCHGPHFYRARGTASNLPA
ncbi:MAG: hypothetical protein ACLP00_13305 [Terracidiphilus sp.]